MRPVAWLENKLVRLAGLVLLCMNLLFQLEGDVDGSGPIQSEEW